MNHVKRRALCGLVCAALLLGGAAGLFAWADRQYAARLASETKFRYAGGVLQNADFTPLDGRESVYLFQRAVSSAALLSTAAPAGPEAVLSPYLPDYGSDLAVAAEAGRWRLFYRTLDGLEITAGYSLAGQESLTVYHPAPDLEVRIAGEALSYTPHARRGVTLPGLWTALSAELSRL